MWYYSCWQSRHISKAASSTLLVCRHHAPSRDMSNGIRRRAEPMACPITWPLFDYWCSLSASLCCCCLTLAFFFIATDHRHVLAAKAVLGVWGAVRELRCQARMPGLGSASSAFIPASGRRRSRRGAGLSAGPPALVRGEEKPGGGCDRRQETNASWKGHPCRLVFASKLFIPLVSPLHPIMLAYCSLHSAV